jgi:methylthioribulose-1-phosphate dehydratase
MAAFTLRGAGCCIHTHSKDAVLVTLLCEAAGTDVFEIQKLEQIKGIPKGYGEEKKGNLGYHDRLRVPIIDNTAHEEDLKDTLEGAIKQWPDTHAVLVKRHGMYVFSCRVAGDENEDADMVLVTFGVRMLLKQRPSAKGRSSQIPNDQSVGD